MGLLKDGMTAEDHLDQLRDWYVGATPRQRLRVIRERLDDHHAGPNRLVTYVSAVEGLARSLLMSLEYPDKDAKLTAYRRFKDRKPVQMVRDFIAKVSSQAPDEVFGADHWRNFQHAVNYRNLLAHECAYLGIASFAPLIDSCEVVLSTLASVGKVPKPARSKRSA